MIVPGPRPHAAAQSPQWLSALSYLGMRLAASNHVAVKPSSTVPSQLLSLPSHTSVAGVVGVHTYSQPLVGSPSRST